MVQYVVDIVNIYLMPMKLEYHARCVNKALVVLSYFCCILVVVFNEITR